MKERSRTIQERDVVFLEHAKIYVRISAIYYIKDMPMDRGNRAGWYIDGKVIRDLNPLFSNEKGRVGEIVKNVSECAISHIVLSTINDRFPMQRIIPVKDKQL